MAVAIAALALAHPGGSALADGAAPAGAGLNTGSAFMRVFGQASPPIGFVRMCQRTPSLCADTPTGEHRVPLVPDRLSELDAVNRQVNQRIAPATDLELYGISEYWTLPDTRGDCEDYALLKRQMLIAKGWPASSLLLTVVRDENGDGHAVLTARTARGDFILDNRVDELRLWHATPYTFVMRQSYLNPRVWISLDPADDRSPAAVGVGTR